MMKPTWALTALGFFAGTLFGALALGDLGAPPAVSTTDPTAADGIPAEVSDPRLAQALTATSDAPSPETPTQDADPPADDPRLAAMVDSWRAAEARIADLQSRLARVEQALAERVQAEVSEPPQAPQGSEERRDTLVAAGVNPELAEDIVWRESRIELERLNLRDQASREGWLGSDRYRAALDALANEGVSLREEIGDAAWDRFLYLTGEDNRVGVSSVIPGSAAEAAGLQPGDVIESYAGGQPFGFNDLRRATTEGEKGELVAVRIRRGDRVFDAWVPRGPLGIRLDMTRAEPLE